MRIHSRNQDANLFVFGPVNKLTSADQVEVKSVLIFNK